MISSINECRLTDLNPNSDITLMYVMELGEGVWLKWSKEEYFDPPPFPLFSKKIIVPSLLDLFKFFPTAIFTL